MEGGKVIHDKEEVSFVDGVETQQFNILSTVKLQCLKQTKEGKC